MTDLTPNVAPRTGARIETLREARGGSRKGSPPARGRGLKRIQPVIR